MYRSKSIWEIEGPSAKCFYIPVKIDKRKKLNKQTPEEFKEKRRIYMKKWYTSKGLHLKKVGRPKKVL